MKMVSTTSFTGFAGNFDVHAVMVLSQRMIVDSYSVSLPTGKLQIKRCSNEREWFRLIRPVVYNVLSLQITV